MELAVLRRWIDLGELDAESGWDAERWQEAIEDCFEEYDSIGTGPDARGPALLQVTTEPGRWVVRQIIDDPEGDYDWAITAVVDFGGVGRGGRGRSDGDWLRPDGRLQQLVVGGPDAIVTRPPG